MLRGSNLIFANSLMFWYSLINIFSWTAELIIDPAAIGDATGTVKIMGNLQVEGTQTTINSSTIVLKDKNIKNLHILSHANNNFIDFQI